MDILILSSTIGSEHMRASTALARGIELLKPARQGVSGSGIAATPRVPRIVEADAQRLRKDLPDVRAPGDLSAHRDTPDFRDPRAGAANSGALGGSVRTDGPGRRSSGRSPAAPGGTCSEDPEAPLVAKIGAKALVAPHFYGAGALGNYKAENPRVFASVVLTDYVPHPVGVPPNLDLYVVADEAAAEAVERLGIPEDRIHPTGIPIDPAFEEPADVPGVRRDVLKFPEAAEDDLPVVIVMGGGLGGGHLEKAVASLLEASAALRLVVLCGSNANACEQLGHIAGRRGRSATFLSFTDRVRDLMAASNVLVTKPGGMSCTEALSAGLPQVLFNPIPGQEEDNSAAMVRYGAGVMVDSPDDILGETLKILTSHNHRRRMSEAARAAHRPRSAEAAARLVLEGMP